MASCLVTGNGNTPRANGLGGVLKVLPNPSLDTTVPHAWAAPQAAGRRLASIRWASPFSSPGDANRAHGRLSVVSTIHMRYTIVQV
jgi:hypothetical protein